MLRWADVSSTTIPIREDVHRSRYRWPSGPHTRSGSCGIRLPPYWSSQADSRGRGGSFPRSQERTSTSDAVSMPTPVGRSIESRLAGLLSGGWSSCVSDHLTNMVHFASTIGPARRQWPPSVVNGSGSRQTSWLVYGQPSSPRTKEIIVQWERRRNRVRDEFIHSMARLKLEGFSPSVKDRARQESLEAEGMAHLEKQMADALARFDVETPRPTKQKCDGCDAIFMPDHALDRYHSRDCANLTRQRRHADRAGKRAVDAEAVGQRRAMRKLEATGRRHRNQVHGGLHVPTCEMCMMFVDAMAAVAPTGTKPAEEKPTRKQHRNTAKRSSPAGDDDECGHDWDDDEGGGDGRFVCTKCGMARRVDPDGRIREI